MPGIRHTAAARPSPSAAGVLNQPLARIMTVRVRCITNKIAKILAFTVVYIHDAS
jgi:hypothetical protein